ncbi:MAG: polysaccharide deacetylase family protein [Candidatus Riflebacteria bacterium]|nr:polysaccharide deacetylase family protein [Candidatus Riflebacteria bacterium]
MRNFKINLKTILTVCMALTIPTILSAATSFASVSPIETKSAVSNTESPSDTNMEENLINSDQLCIDTNLGRSRLKELLLEKRAVALTFDDGPHPLTTPHILDILKKRHVKATFFVLGIQAKKYPELIKRIYDEGHIVGNHTYSHKNLSKLKTAAIKNEIENTNKLIEKITGEKPKYIRPPYGAINKTVISAIKDAGMSMVLWTVDTRDWHSKNEKSVLKEVDRQLHISKGDYIGGAILMHDIYPSTVRSLDPVLDKLAANEYKVYSINNLGNSESDFWSVKTPIICKKPISIHANPEISKNPLMISLLKEKPKEKVTQLGMLKARKEGNLLIYLAMSN